jgi:hypothetical protein
VVVGAIVVEGGTCKTIGSGVTSFSASARIVPAATAATTPAVPITPARIGHRGIRVGLIEVSPRGAGACEVALFPRRGCADGLRN